jgi:hypothetical protein
MARFTPEGVSVTMLATRSPAIFHSIHELRRRSPLHFLARADNARFTAYVLWNLDQAAGTRCAGQIGYHGTPEIAAREAFSREAALSLELIIKAVIAQRIETGRRGPMLSGSDQRRPICCC